MGAGVDGGLVGIRGARSFRLPCERAERTSRCDSPRREAAPWLLGESVRVGKRTPCGSADHPDRLAPLELVWDGRRWRRDKRAVGGARTAGRERSAVVERPGSGGADLPDQASNARGPVRAAVRRGRAARPRRKGIAGVRAPAVRRRSAPAAERTRAATWRTGERRRLRADSLGVRQGALASRALWRVDNLGHAPAGIGGVVVSTEIGAGGFALGGRCGPYDRFFRFFSGWALARRPHGVPLSLRGE